MKSGSGNEPAEHMYIPFDEKLGIHPQDDAFLEKEVWDFKNISPGELPTLIVLSSTRHLSISSHQASRYRVGHVSPWPRFLR